MSTPPSGSGGRTEVDVVVVGSGPNGLSAAVCLASAGLSVEVHEAAEGAGGGARTLEMTLPGFRHDHCSIAHPAGAASAFFRAFDLAASGVEWLQPEVPFAHPLDGGRAGLAHRDLGATADGLGADGRAWRSLLGPLVEHIEEVVSLTQSDLRTFPAVPRTASGVAATARTAVRLGLRAVEQGSPLWDARFRSDAAPALLTGASAHNIADPRTLASAGAGLYLAAMAHAGGWPVVRGGTQALTDALVAEVERLGGRVVLGHRVSDLRELPRARAVLLDVAPSGLLAMAGDALPAPVAAVLRRYRYGGAVCKVDFALSGPVPWTAPGLDRAGTLHLGGTRAQVLASEREVAAGRHSPNPFTIVVQPGVVDPTRAPGGAQTLWTYAHVPHGSRRDLAEEVTAQVERFAPGFRDLVLHTTTTTASRIGEQNASMPGGDIAAGAVTPWQLAMRPLPAWDPGRVRLRRSGGDASGLPEEVHLCGAATPPGPAVTGMNGVHAARRVLRQRFGTTTDPLELVRRARAGVVAAA